MPPGSYSPARGRENRPVFLRPSDRGRGHVAVSGDVSGACELLDVELREVELEENLRRSDLTAYERSRTLAELADTAAEVDRSEGVTRHGDAKLGRPAAEVEKENPSQRETGSRGPRPEPASLRSVAERIGESKDTIARAREHVAAVDRYPELQAVPTQKDAVAIATPARTRRRRPQASAPNGPISGSASSCGWTNVPRAPRLDSSGSSGVSLSSALVFGERARLS